MNLICLQKAKLPLCSYVIRYQFWSWTCSAQELELVVQDKSIMWYSTALKILFLERNSNTVRTITRLQQLTEFLSIGKQYVKFSLAVFFSLFLVSIGILCSDKMEIKSSGYLAPVSNPPPHTWFVVVTCSDRRWSGKITAQSIPHIQNEAIWDTLFTRDIASFSSWITGSAASTPLWRFPTKHETQPS